MRPLLVFDMEVYVNYTLLLFKDPVTKAVTRFELPLTSIEKDALAQIIKTYRLVSFNGWHYDIPLMFMALKGDDSAKIKKASDRIIVHGAKNWVIEREFGVNCHPKDLDHVDLMEVAPLKGSLKLYGGRLHSRSLQDLPISPSKVVTDADKVILRSYCENDCDTLTDLLHALKEQCALREQMSEQYGIDLRSKSDAQIAEAVIKKEVESRTNTILDRPGADPGNRFHYTIPPWMGFDRVAILDAIKDAWFVIADDGKVLMPPELEKRDMVIAGRAYRMGVGGLHSTEKRQTVLADDEHVLVDFDVVSYYPSILLNQGMYPKHIGPEFLSVYKELVARRLRAKERANELKKEIANVKQMIYNLEHEKKESHVSQAS